MELSEAFILSDKISWGYSRRGNHEAIINRALLEHLGPALYKLFCEKINEKDKTSVAPEYQENFSLEYSENPDCALTDMVIATNWSLGEIFSVLIELYKQ